MAVVLRNERTSKIREAPWSCTPEPTTVRRSVNPGLWDGRYSKTRGRGPLAGDDGASHRRRPSSKKERNPLRGTNSPNGNWSAPPIRSTMQMVPTSAYQVFRCDQSKMRRHVSATLSSEPAGSPPLRARALHGATGRPRWLPRRATATPGCSHAPRGSLASHVWSLVAPSPRRLPGRLLPSNSDLVSAPDNRLLLRQRPAPSSPPQESQKNSIAVLPGRRREGGLVRASLSVYVFLGWVGRIGASIRSHTLGTECGLSLALSGP